MEKQILVQFNSGTDKKVKVISSFQIHEPTIGNRAKYRIKKSKYIQ